MDRPDSPPGSISNIEEMPDDHGLTRYEVIEGELYEMSEPHLIRQAVITTLCAIFGRTLEADPLGKAFPAPPVVINKHDRGARGFSYLRPDFAYVSNKRFNEVTNGLHFTAAPDLVIEVVIPEDESDSADRRLKRSIFREIGVPEYWIVNLEQQSIFSFAQSGLVTEFEGDNHVTSSVLPALRFTVRELFTSSV